MAESCNLIELEELFLKATNYVKSIVSTLSSEDLLEFYGLYKQTTIGPCNISKPNWYSFEGKEKWNAWNKLGQMTQNDAMLAYCRKMKMVDAEWEVKIKDKEVEDTEMQSWVATSRFRNLDDELMDSDKNIFEWAKEGNVDQVKILSKSCNVNELDDNGLALLHWAADRGDLKLVELLVSTLNADINIQDAEGQTPLHYATSCDHIHVVQYLLGKKAETNVKDMNGLLPTDVTENVKIKNLFLIKN